MSSFKSRSSKHNGWNSRHGSTLGSRAIASLVIGGTLLALTAAVSPSATASGAAPVAPRLTPAFIHSGAAHQIEAPASAECYTNMREDAGASYVSQNFEADLDLYDSTAADDFEIATDCTVTSIQVPGTYFNGSGPAVSETVTFYTDGDGKPGTILDTQTVTGSDTAGSFDIALAPIELAARTRYWVSVQVNMDIRSGGEWGWEATSTQQFDPAQWQNPADGFQTGCTTWTNLESCLGPLGPDLQFVLSGEDSDSSQTFAGYTTSLGNVGAKQVKNIGLVFPNPPNICTGKPNGVLYVFTYGWMTSSDSGVYGIFTISCLNGVPHFTFKWCYWAWTYNSCRPVPPIKIDPGNPISMRMAAKHGETVMTVTNLDTGKSVSRRAKLADPTTARIGISSLKPNGKSYRIRAFDPIQVQDVTVNGVPLERQNPTAVTMYDAHRQAVAAPSGFGDEGTSFQIGYLGH